MTAAAQAEFCFATELMSADVVLSRDGAWFVAQPVALKPGYVTVTGSMSKVSFEDAARLLRRLLNATRHRISDNT